MAVSFGQWIRIGSFTIFRVNDRSTTG